MKEQEIKPVATMISPEMGDVLRELADDKGMDLDTVMRQHEIIMGHLGVQKVIEKTDE